MPLLRRSLFYLSVLAIFVVGRYFDGRQSFDPVIRGSMAHAVTALDQEALGLDPGRFDLFILPIRKRRSESQLNRMLRKWDHHDGPVYYWLSEKYDNLIYTMSALGIDGRQHLAHAYLEGYEPFVTDNVMIPLYALAQRKSYQLDKRNYWGKEDVWQTSRQAFYYTRGDCEDHAIVLADWLSMMGEDARVVIGEWGDGGHAWVILFRDGKEFLLEATRKNGLGRNQPYPLASLHPEYRPRFMFNHEYFWVNTGSPHTRRYSGPAWIKSSRYSQYED